MSASKRFSLRGSISSNEDEQDSPRDSRLRSSSSSLRMNQGIPMDEFMRMLEEKENMVRMAAQIGQNLLEKNKQLEEQTSSLTDLLSQRNMYIEELLSQLEELREENDKQKLLTHEAELNYSTLHSKHDSLRTTVNSAEKENIQYIENLQALEKKNKKLSMELAESNLKHDKLKTTVNNLEETNLKQRKEIEKLHQKELDFKKSIAQLNMEKTQLHAQVEDLSDSEKRLEKHIEVMSKTLTSYEKKYEEESNNSIDNLSNSSAHPSTIEFELKKEIDLLMRENLQWSRNFEQLMILHQQQQEDFNLLQEQSLSSGVNIRNQTLQTGGNRNFAPIKSVDAEENTNKNTSTSNQLNRNSNITNQKLIDTKASSIFDEISEEMKREFSNKVRDKKEPELPSLAGDVSQSENYFFLTTCAVKISIAMERSKFGHSNDNTAVRYPPGLTISKLYDKAIKDEIPFHEWHSWTKKQFMDVLKETEPSTFSYLFRGFRSSTSQQPPTQEQVAKSPSRITIFKNSILGTPTKSNNNSNNINSVEMDNT